MPKNHPADQFLSPELPQLLREFWDARTWHKNAELSTVYVVTYEPVPAFTLQLTVHFDRSKWSKHIIAGRHEAARPYSVSATIDQTDWRGYLQTFFSRVDQAKFELESREIEQLANALFELAPNVTREALRASGWSDDDLDRLGGDAESLAEEKGRGPFTIPGRQTGANAPPEGAPLIDDGVPF